MAEHQKTSRALTLRYAPLQGIYWASFGCIIAFASVFLLPQGFSNTQIGVILAIANAVAVLLQPLLASLVDTNPRFTPRYIALTLMAACLACVLCILFFSPSLLVMSVLYCAAGTFILTVQPFLNSMAFTLNTPAATTNFGFARGVGSISFGTLALLLGIAASAFGPQVVLFLFVFLAGLLLVFMYAYKPAKNHTPVSASGAVKPEQSSAVGFVKNNPHFIGFALSICFLFMGYQMCITYIKQIIDALSGTTRDVGAAQMFAAVLELFSMIAFSRLVKKIPVHKLLKFSSVFFTVKALCYLIASFAGLYMVYTAQFFQAFSFGLFIPASVHYADILLPAQDKTKGQALVTTAITAGGVIGTLAGGILLDNFGMFLMLAVAVAASLLGTGLTFPTARSASKPAQG